MKHSLFFTDNALLQYSERIGVKRGRWNYARLSVGEPILHYSLKYEAV